MKIDRNHGGRCSHPLRVEIEDGASLTPEDVTLVDVLFGNERVMISHAREVAEVYLYLWTSMNVPKGRVRTLRGVGYGKLLETDTLEDVRGLAEEVGKQILGCNVELSMNRKPSCKAYIIARCRLVDFMRNL